MVMNMVENDHDTLRIYRINTDIYKIPRNPEWKNQEGKIYVSGSELFGDPVCYRQNGKMDVRDIGKFVKLNLLGLIR